MKIDQNKFFDGLGFEEFEVNGEPCFKGPDGCFYRMDHFSQSYVIECADSADDAEVNRFEDADIFDDDLPEAELITQVQNALREYVKG